MTGLISVSNHVFSTTLDLAPNIDQITDEFLSYYYPKTMGVTVISGLSRTPEITIPIANDVPIGLSFIAGYEHDMLLVNFCNELHKKLIRN